MKWSIAVALHSPSLRTLEVLSHRRRLNRCAFGCCSRRSYSTVSFHPQDLSDSSLSLHLQKHTTALHQRETHAKCGTEMKTVSKREGLCVAVNDICWKLCSSKVENSEEKTRRLRIRSSAEFLYSMTCVVICSHRRSHLKSFLQGIL